MRLITHKLVRFKPSYPLLITSIYPGSGKSTLAINLVKQIKEQDPNIDIRLYQLDELYMFLRIDKWFPKDILNMNILEFEQFLKNDSYKSHRKESQILCIQFLKDKHPELFNKLYKHRFGEEFFLIDKDYHNKDIWNEWTKYVLHYCKYTYNGLAIVEGGQLTSILNEDNESEYDCFIIVDTPEEQSLYQKVQRDVEQYNPNSFRFINQIRTYYNYYKRMFNRKDRIWKIIEKNKEDIIYALRYIYIADDPIEIPDNFKISFDNERIQFLDIVKSNKHKSSFLNKLSSGDKYFIVWVTLLLSRLFIKSIKYDIGIFSLAAITLIYLFLKELNKRS